MSVKNECFQKTSSLIVNIMHTVIHFHCIFSIRWVCTSGLAADLATTDEIAAKVLEEIMEEECKQAVITGK